MKQSNILNLIKWNCKRIGFIGNLLLQPVFLLLYDSPRHLFNRRWFKTKAWFTPTVVYLSDSHTVDELFKNTISGGKEMKNIENICKDLGIEIPEDKAKSFHDEVMANYKTIADYDKLVTKANKFEEDLKTANETLEKFKDIDPDKIADEIADYKQKAEDAEKNFKAELEKRDYNDAIDKLLGDIKFSSEAAKRAFKSDLIENPLQLRNGAVVGFDDVLKQAKESDPSAFVDETKETLENNKAKFTTGMKDNGGGTTAKTKEEIMAIKDASERQAAIRENISLFTN